MADEYGGWALQPAPTATHELAGWTLQPAAQPTAPAPKPTDGEALRRGLTQGSTLGYGDEITGAVGSGVLQLAKLLGAGKSRLRQGPVAISAGLPDDTSSTIPGTVDAYRNVRDSERQANRAAEEAHPREYGGSELAGSALASMAPGLSALNVGKGTSLARALAKSAATGALGGLGASESKTTLGDAGNALAGGGVGLAAGGLARLLGVLGQKAFGKVADIDEAVARKAAATANAETLSARSAAGTAAQDAYKQLEHLRELGSLRKLSPDEAQVAAGLEQELAQKAQEKLLPAAARKEATAQAFRDAISTESQRAQALAEQKLSGGEAATQLKARLLRYGLPAAGGALAGMAGFGGHGAFVGAGSGALMGAGLRPMMQSLFRMAGQPAVARPVTNFAGHALTGLLEPAVERTAGGAALALSPDIAAIVEALRKKPEPDTSTWTPEPQP